MPSLTVAAWGGLLVGAALARMRASAPWFAYGPARPAVLARVRWSAWWLFPAGLAFGALVSVAMVMHTMELADPFTTGGLVARWSELWARLKDWVGALIFGGVSADPLPFVLLMVFVTWIVPYLSGWGRVPLAQPVARARAGRGGHPHQHLLPAGSALDRVHPVPVRRDPALHAPPAAAHGRALGGPARRAAAAAVARGAPRRGVGGRAAHPHLLARPDRRGARPGFRGVGTPHPAGQRPRRPLRPGVPRHRLEARQPHPPL